MIKWIGGKKNFHLQVETEKRKSEEENRTHKLSRNINSSFNASSSNYITNTNKLRYEIIVQQNEVNKEGKIHDCKRFIIVIIYE